MKFLLFLLVLLMYKAKQAESNDEFVTLWAPKYVHDTKDYNVIVMPQNIDKDTEISLHFHKSFGTVRLVNEKIHKVEVNYNLMQSAATSFKLAMILSRNVTNKAQPQCIERQLNKINLEKRPFHIFIQLDKPIYKPGDTVKFRAIYIDRDLKPYHANNIEFNITDPFDRLIKYDPEPEGDEDGNYFGITHGTFNIGEHTALGWWKIAVTINNMYQYTVNKSFEIAKYVLPEFAAYLKANDVHLLTNSDLSLTFYAQYAFGDFVKGTAKLTIRNTTANELEQVFFTKTYTNLEAAKTDTFSVTDHLKVITNGEVNLEALLEFTEPESDITVSQTLNIVIHGNTKRKLRVYKPDRFMPGLAFGIRLSVYSWNDELIESAYDQVEIYFRFNLKNGSTKVETFEKTIVDGFVILNYIVPVDAQSLKLEIKYNDAIHRETLVKGELDKGENNIAVKHSPMKPKFDEMVEIFIRSDIEMDQVVIVVMSRFGNVQSHHIRCDFKLVCTHKFKVTRQMIPKATVIAYHLKDKTTIYQGKTELTLDTIGKNFLDIDLPITPVKTGQNIIMTFDSKLGSEVFLLAYDKRLTYLAKGNEVTRNDVVEEISTYNDNNAVTVFKMDDWKDCTQKQLDYIAKGRKLTINHGGEIFTFEQDNDFYNENDEAYFEDDPMTTEIAEGEKVDEIRENFPETWLYESFTIPQEGTIGTVQKKFLIPDSITTWKISAFALHNKFGLAVADTKELIVKNEFFTKIFLPYSIRYKETLRVDILVYNYIATSKPLDVTVYLGKSRTKNDYEFVDHDKNCNPTPTDVSKVAKQVTVPSNGVKRVSFFVRPRTTQRFFSKTIQFVVEAYGQSDGVSYRDRINKNLRVEPIGVKNFKDFEKAMKLRNNGDSFEVSHTGENNTAFPKFLVSIGAEYAVDNTHLPITFVVKGCLSQRTSSLKAGVEFYRYMKTKEPDRAPPVTNTYFFQEILNIGPSKWQYRGQVGFRSFFLETYASGIEQGILPINLAFIENEIEQTKALQQPDGSFKNFGVIPTVDLTGNALKYFQTAYTLIPLLKLRRLKVTEKFNDVIEKGFKFLEIPGIPDFRRDALSMAAIAYVLNDNTEQANKLLERVEMFRMNDKKYEKKACMKLLASDNNCHRRHTAYTAIAYLMMNKTTKAGPLVNNLLEKNYGDYYHDPSFEYAVSIEAIARMALKSKGRVTDFKVQVTNENNFMKELHITKKSSWEPHFVTLPDFSLNAKVNVSGSGFASVLIRKEVTVFVNQTSKLFDITVIRNETGGRKNEEIIQICATYNPKEPAHTLNTLTNVIYDIEFPSGYAYKEIVNMRTDQIKLVEPVFSNSRVILYYENFHKDTAYCADVKAIKVMEVQKLQQAGVRIYDFNNNRDVGVAFYSFDSGTCAL